MLFTADLDLLPDLLCLHIRIEPRIQIESGNQASPSKGTIASFCSACEWAKLQQNGALPAGEAPSCYDLILNLFFQFRNDIIQHLENVILPHFIKMFGNRFQSIEKAWLSLSVFRSAGRCTGMTAP